MHDILPCRATTSINSRRVEPLLPKTMSGGLSQPFIWNSCQPAAGSLKEDMISGHLLKGLKSKDRPLWLSSRSGYFKLKT